MPRLVNCTTNLKADALLYASVVADSGLIVPCAGRVPTDGRLQLVFDACIPTGGANLTLITTGMQDLNGRVLLPLEPQQEGPPFTFIPGPNSFKPTRPLPPIPSREQACRVFLHFQGLTVCEQRFWDPMLASWNDMARQVAYATKLAAGDTHINLTLDLTGLACLPKLRAIITEALQYGFIGCLLCCMGDGQTTNVPPGGHDPGALGWEWLMANFQAIYTFMKGDGNNPDLTPYLVFCPGYDGVVPAWQPPSRCDDFTLMARKVIDAGGSGYLAMYLSAGYCVWAGAEANNWVTPGGRAVDVIVLELPEPIGPPAWPAQTPQEWAHMSNSQKAPWTQVWQILGRLIRPYVASDAQIAVQEDLHPPLLTSQGTPRGPYVVIPYEYDTYYWIKDPNSITEAEVMAHRRALQALVPEASVC